MIQRSHHSSFALEACRELLLGNLHRDDAVEPRVASLVHLAHATRAEGRKDLVGPEFVACRKWHISDAAILADQRTDYAPTRKCSQRALGRRAFRPPMTRDQRPLGGPS